MVQKRNNNYVVSCQNGAGKYRSRGMAWITTTAKNDLPIQ